MAKRDYKAEYQRRVAKGLERGYSRAQAAGHPRKGESGVNIFQNFFKDMQSKLKSMISDVGNIFRDYEEANCEPREEAGHKVDKTYVLPHYYVGDAECIPNRKAFENLWNRVRQERIQSFYAFWITGVTEEEYPQKEGELTITLSYRLSWRAVQEALNNRSNRTLADVVNAMIPAEHDERWLSIEQVAIVNKT
jgi:hypothetical protein